LALLDCDPQLLTEDDTAKFTCEGKTLAVTSTLGEGSTATVFAVVWGDGYAVAKVFKPQVDISSHPLALP